jgi:type IV fimbrial biogenesis protein FimT
MELMVVLAVAGTILAIGAPSFSEFRRNNRLTGTSNDFLGALLSARTEAIKRQQPVSVCASSNSSTDSPTCSGGAFTGWIVFEDTNGNCTRDSGEMLLRAQPPIETGIKTNSSDPCVPFAPTGFVTPKTPDSKVRYVLFCDDRGLAKQQGTQVSAGRGVMVTPTGRARISRDLSSASEEDMTKWPFGCP